MMAGENEQKFLETAEVVKRALASFSYGELEAVLRETMGAARGRVDAVGGGGRQVGPAFPTEALTGSGFGKVVDKRIDDALSKLPVNVATPLSPSATNALSRHVGAQVSNALGKMPPGGGGHTPQAQWAQHPHMATGNMEGTPFMATGAASAHTMGVHSVLQAIQTAFNKWSTWATMLTAAVGKLHQPTGTASWRTGQGAGLAGPVDVLQPESPTIWGKAKAAGRSARAGFGSYMGGLGGVEQSGGEMQGIGALAKGTADFAKLIPVIGQAASGLLGLVGGAFMVTGAFMKLNRSLFDANMQFSQFSAGMAQVQAKQMARDINLSAERGDRLAPSAERQAQAMARLERAMAPIADKIREGVNNAVSGVIEHLELAAATTKGIWENVKEGNFSMMGIAASTTGILHEMQKDRGEFGQGLGTWMDNISDSKWEKGVRPQENPRIPGPGR